MNWKKRRKLSNDHSGLTGKALCLMQDRNLAREEKLPTNQLLWRKIDEDIIGKQLVKWSVLCASTFCPTEDKGHS